MDSHTAVGWPALLVFFLGDTVGGMLRTTRRAAANDQSLAPVNAVAALFTHAETTRLQVIVIVTVILWFGTLF